MSLEQCLSSENLTSFPLVCYHFPPRSLKPLQRFLCSGNFQRDLQDLQGLSRPQPHRLFSLISILSSPFLHPLRPFFRLAFTLPAPTMVPLQVRSLPSRILSIFLQSGYGSCWFPRKAFPDTLKAALMFKLRAATSIGGVAGGSELECPQNWVGTPDKGKILGVRPTGQGWRLFWGYNDPLRLPAWLCPLCASYILSVCG